MEPKERYNFLLYGDSISKGIIYDEKRKKYVTLDQSFANIIKQKLKGAFYNAGKFGSTIIRGEKKLEHELIKSNPDIALIEFGGNDCDYKWQEICENPKKHHEPNTDLGMFETTLINIIDTFKKIDIVPVLMTLPPLNPDRYFKWITKNNPMNENTILSFIGNINHLYFWHEKYNFAIMDAVEKTKTICIDIRSAFLKEEDYTKFICVDGIHPNEQGHKLIANTIIEYIKFNYSYLLA
jgi:acyl-CoA thioesterase I